MAQPNPPLPLTREEIFEARASKKEVTFFRELREMKVVFRKCTLKKYQHCISNMKTHTANFITWTRMPSPALRPPPLTPPNTHWKDNGMGHCSPYCMDYAAQIAWILQLTSTRWQHFLTKNCPSWWTSVAYGLDTNCGVLLIYLWGADFGAKYLSSQ